MGDIMAFDTKPFNEDKFMMEEFLMLKKEHKIKTVVETGTFHGVTTKWFCDNFDNVLTVEVNAEFHKKAEENLADCENVKMYLGSSVNILENLLPSLSDKGLLMFLDAHWYSNPLIGELQAIAKAKKKPFLVLHDFKVPDKDFAFDSYNGQDYEWSWVEPYIKEIYGEGGYDHYFNKEATGARAGCVFVKPKAM